MTLDLMSTTFTPAEAVAAGASRHAVYSWRNAGQIVEISRGVYRKADAPTTAYLDLIAVAKRAPRGVVCLVSALAVHELTDEIPAAVQMAVPNTVNVPHVAYPPTEFSRFDARTFDLGRTRFEAASGEWVPVYSPERAVADAMRLRHRVGDQVALRALRAYLSRRDASPASLAELARRLGDAADLIRAVQVVLS